MMSKKSTDQASAASSSAKVNKPTQNVSTAVIKNAPANKSLQKAGVNFPLSLGRDITVTATSKTSTSDSAGALNFPNNANKLKVPTSTATFSNFGNLPAALRMFSQANNNAPAKNQADPRNDPQNLAFSVLKNLPASMSLLVKQPATGSGSASVQQATKARPVELTKSNLAPAMPKLTPAPGISKKGT